MRSTRRQRRIDACGPYRGHTVHSAAAGKRRLLERQAQVTDYRPPHIPLSLKQGLKFSWSPRQRIETDFFHPRQHGFLPKCSGERLRKSRDNRVWCLSWHHNALPCIGLEVLETERLLYRWDIRQRLKTFG